MDDVIEKLVEKKRPYTSVSPWHEGGFIVLGFYFAGQWCKEQVTIADTREEAREEARKWRISRREIV